MSIDSAIKKIADVSWLKEPRFIRKWLPKEELLELRLFVKNLEDENATLKKENEELKEEISNYIEDSRTAF